MRMSSPLHLQAAVAATASALALTGCAGPLHSRAGAYEARTVAMRFHGRDLKVTYVTPQSPITREFLIVFASGDAGYWGVSTEIVEHLAAEQYYLVTYDGRQLVARERKSNSRSKIKDFAALYDTMLVDARRSLGLPDDLPVILTGYSRGANMVVITAGLESLRHHLAGAVAIALCPTTDYVKKPTPEDHFSSVPLDAKGHLLTYEAIPLAGALPFAVIQGTEDSYIPAHEARLRFGPDTPRRRFYAVEGSHTFGGSRDVLLRDLDDALEWIHAASFAK